METILWVVQILLAVAFLGSGTMKLMKSKTDLAKDPRMAWTEDFTAERIRMISAVEVLGAIGLVLPAALNVVPVLTPVAATGLALTMAVAALTHFRRGELQQLPINAVLFALCAFVAIERFGPHSL